MSEYLSKKAVLEWLYGNMRTLSGWQLTDRLHHEIKTGTFDLPADTDTIGELDAYTRMMHERNERLRKALEGAKHEQHPAIIIAGGG